MSMHLPDTDQCSDYEAPALTVLGTLTDLTAQKSGTEPDGLKGEGDITFPSGFRQQP
jgi:hypothetical protein